MHARNGMHITDIQYLMGHRSILTTARYIQHDPKRIENMQSNLDYVEMFKTKSLNKLKMKEQIKNLKKINKDLKKELNIWKPRAKRIKWENVK